MNVPFEFESPEQSRIVYVREVNVSDLPADVREQAGDADHLYAVHSENGERLALVADRDLAFMLARQNDFSPVTVH